MQVPTRRVDTAPLPVEDQALLEERLAEHRRAPDEARPWDEIIERVPERLHSGR